jgi:hypothetical protein
MNMAKFALLSGAAQTPLQVYEGDYMQMEKAYVTIYNYSTADRTGVEQTANIHLEKGQSVKKISD